MSPTAAANILQLRLDEISASPLNPRRHFAEADLRELGESMKTSGQHELLLVRPLVDGGYELANGERRWRAAKLVGLPHLEARVQELTDGQMLDIMLLTGTTGESLSPIEEAEGYAARMKMDGLSQDALAKHLGMSPVHISMRMALLDLPTEARKMADAGMLPARTAWLIARVPGDEARKAVAKLVLHPPTGEGPLTFRATQALVETNFCRSLQGAPFDAKDALLVPAAGSCMYCPHRAGSNAETYGDVKNPHTCMLPACFESKVAAARAALARSYAKQGLVVLAEDENAKAFPRGDDGLSYRCGYVEFHKPVPKDLLKREVTTPPKWTDICHGPKARVQVHVGFDQEGKAVELVKVAEAVTAADENERQIFNEETRVRYGLENQKRQQLPPERGQRPEIRGQTDKTDRPQSPDPIDETVKALRGEVDEAVNWIEVSLRTGRHTAAVRIAGEAILTRHGRLEDGVIDPATLKLMQKARTSGMSDEQIAKEFKTTVGDVVGALGEKSFAT